MKNTKLTIFLAVTLLIVLGVSLGGYYYYKKTTTNKATQTPQTNTNTTTKTDAQIQNDKLKDEVIRNSPEPEGIAQPKYQAAPTPPPPPK